MCIRDRYFCDRLSAPATPFDWILGISLLAVLLSAELTFVVAHKAPVTNAPVPAELELANRESGLPNWASYELAKR